MNDTLWIALITALSGIIPAVITAYIGFKKDQREFELEEQKIKNDQRRIEIEERKKGVKNKNAEENKETFSSKEILKNVSRQTNLISAFWRSPVLLAFVLGGVLSFYVLQKFVFVPAYNIIPSQTPTPTQTPFLTPTPTYTFTPTPIVCPYQRATDDETIVALIQAEVVAAQGKYMNIVNDIFDPDAIFQDYAGTPASAVTPAAEWQGAFTRYEEVFATVDFKDSRHFDILPAGLGISGETATYTSGSDITYKKVGSDLWTHQINGSINSTNYGSEHWILKKNTTGCWIIAQMEFNAGHIQFP